MKTPTINHLSKSLKLIIALLFVSSALRLDAQDVTNQPSPAAVTYASASPYKRAAIDLWDIAKSVAPSTNDIYTLSVGYGKNTGNGETIMAGMLSIVNTNGTGVSLVGGKIGGQWEYGGGAFSLGRVDSWPVIGSVQESIGDGVIYDFQTHDPQNYSFVRIAKDWPLGKGEIGIGGMIANRSGTTSADWIIGAHGGFRF